MAHHGKRYEAARTSIDRERTYAPGNSLSIRTASG